MTANLTLPIIRISWVTPNGAGTYTFTGPSGLADAQAHYDRISAKPEILFACLNEDGAKPVNFTCPDAVRPLGELESV